MTVINETEDIKNPLSESKLNIKGLCDYVINVATGCLHGCTFCLVTSMPTIRMRSNGLKERGVEDPLMDWGKYTFLRDDIPPKLEALLSRKRNWKSTSSGKGVVMLSISTDPYQNSKTAAVTRETVKVLLAHGKRVRILTRSPLWTQDIDILSHPNVTVGMSIPHLDDELSREIEPYAPPPSARLKAMKEGQKNGVRLFVAIAPTVPFHGVNEFCRTRDAILPLNPEVIFWEPINVRGTNIKRMLASGLDWAENIRDTQEWARKFEQQYLDMENAYQWANASKLLHPWFDKQLVGHCRILDPVFVKSWFYRPTIEKWEAN